MTDPRDRLEYLRGEIEAERISYSELAELQNLVPWIDPTDVVLLQWAGVPEFPEDNEAAPRRRWDDDRDGIEWRQRAAASPAPLDVERLARAGGSVDVSPRLPTGELAQWCRAFIAGIDAERRRAEVRP